MWPDNETDRDFLNFTGVADTIAEIVVQAQGRPISIGVSGAWGVGKSSMIKLIRTSLTERAAGGDCDFVFVEFNAWLYQGYDDARAALMEVIAATLAEEAEKRKKGIEKAKEFLERINWLRVAKLVGGSALSISMGLPPVGLVGELLNLGKDLAAGGLNETTLSAAQNAASDVAGAASGLLAARAHTSPPREIHALRQSFEDAVAAMGVTLVVLIDDLDRCLPGTTISTLEAIRLFLFLKSTAFVIAADDEMIKHAVRLHFSGPDDRLVVNYFDKLIQLPIMVPPLGLQEVRAYMMLLFIENSDLASDVKDRIRASVCEQLGQTWQGKRVDRAFLQTLHNDYSPELIGQFDTADRLAPFMATASGIAGNPRLVKRFLNTLAIRMANSRAHGVAVDEAVLVKMLLFERLATPEAYSALTKAITENAEGKPVFLAEWERTANEGGDLELDAPWNDAFVREWLTLPPALSDRDLRGVLYISREHSPLITAQDRLSSEAAELLAALLSHPDMAEGLDERLTKLPRPEITIMMDRLLERARQEQEWGVPPILEAGLVVSKADPPQGARLAGFLSERPPAQIQPNLIPKIGDQPWARSVFDAWDKMPNLSPPVKAAIKRWRENGNIAV